MRPPTEIIRHESDAGRWELILRPPDARLRAEVLVLEDYDEHLADPSPQRQLPTLFVPLILSFGSRYRVSDPLEQANTREYDSFGAGLSEFGAVTESAGQARCVQVNLTPLGARRILGVPMHELADRVVPLANVLGREADRLEERLADASDAEDRLGLVESFLFARLDAAPPPRADVAYAWRRLEESAGRLRIGALAAELGCSRKHLTAQFRDHVGLPPKLVARLMRFNRALRLVEGGGAGGADIAFRCGYTDQAHFINEFRRFSGSTPGAFARDPQAQVLQELGEWAA